MRQFIQFQHGAFDFVADHRVFKFKMHDPNGFGQFFRRAHLAQSIDHAIIGKSIYPSRGIIYVIFELVFHHLQKYVLHGIIRIDQSLEPPSDMRFHAIVIFLGDLFNIFLAACNAEQFIKLLCIHNNPSES